MFKFGGFDTANVDGLSAVLKVWPGLGEVTTDVVTSAGHDGVFYAGASLAPTRFGFNLYARGVDPADVLGVAETVSGALAPHGGLRDLEIDVAPGWVWRVNTDSPIDWARGKWVPGHECYLFAEVEFLAADPYGYALPGESWQWETVGSRSVTRAKGNVDSFPTVEIEGALTGSQSVTITVAGRQVKVDGPLTSGRVLRLDYQNADFGIWNGATKVSSVVKRMSSFDMLTLPAGSSTVAVSTTGSVTNVRVDANSRRL